MYDIVFGACFTGAVYILFEGFIFEDYSAPGCTRIRNVPILLAYDFWILWMCETSFSMYVWSIHYVGNGPGVARTQVFYHKHLCFISCVQILEVMEDYFSQVDVVCQAEGGNNMAAMGASCGLMTMDTPSDDLRCSYMAIGTTAAACQVPTCLQASWMWYGCCRIFQFCAVSAGCAVSVYHPYCQHVPQAGMTAFRTVWNCAIHSVHVQ